MIREKSSRMGGDVDSAARSFVHEKAEEAEKLSMREAEWPGVGSVKRQIVS